MGIVKLKLVIKAISAGVLPNRSQVLYGSIFWKDGSCPCLEGEIWPFSFFLLIGDEGLFESDCLFVRKKTDMCLLVVCYIEKWYEIWQKISKHEDEAFTLFKMFL